MAIDIPSYILGKEKGGDRTEFIVEEKTFSSNGTYVAPEGHAYSPVTVQIEHPEDLIEGIKRTIHEDIPMLKSKYLESMGTQVVEEFDTLITRQFIRVLFYLTGE